AVASHLQVKEFEEAQQWMSEFIRGGGFNQFSGQSADLSSSGTSIMVETNQSAGPYNNWATVIGTDDVYVNTSVSVILARDGAKIVGHFGASSIMDTFGKTFINASIAYDGEDARVNIAISVYLNQTKVGTDMSAPLARGTLFAEWQHVMDLVTGLKDRYIPELYNTLNLIRSSQYASTNRQVENSLMLTTRQYFSDRIVESSERHDCEGCAHNGGVLFVPKDFNGF
ncbi:hypothetical protein MLD52_22725, partial [Puniceicoccaceae bacterium K14]|nr:hypothetical protein [Puniceicoccaceae bacterium K14]